MRYVLILLLLAGLVWLPGTRAKADDLDASILWEVPAWTCLGGTIRFWGGGSSGAAHYYWDINNDGQYDIQDGPATIDADWAYFGIGGKNHTVKLTVWDSTLQNSDTAYATNIYVGEPKILGEQQLGTYVVNFNGTYSEPTTASLSHQYAWDFDDDDITDSTSGTPSHDFESSGDYWVTLGVRYDAEGSHHPAVDVWYCEKRVRIHVN